MTGAGASRVQGMRFGQQGPSVRGACSPAAAGGGRAAPRKKRRHSVKVHSCWLGRTEGIRDVGREAVSIAANLEHSHAERVCNRDAKGRQPSGTSSQSRPEHACSHYVEIFEAHTGCWRRADEN